MREQVEAFLADLLSIGMKRDQCSEKGYEFAVAIQMDEEYEGKPVTAAMMLLAADLVKRALPGAYRIYELRSRMH